MRTKEEILNSRFPKPDDLVDGKIRDLILEAMDEYAKEFSIEFGTGLLGTFGEKMPKKWVEHLYGIYISGEDQHPTGEDDK